ncbi:hypothetical protein J0871_17005 [Salegentibacter sp. BDJ18]|uniref:hypothetical protein n=1 Tax=Salegentibacter sp. BDJ18 TaxID=2816376 RepID=UPI001AAFD77D|nr:hypothetical protein [Salegentibacter sp. BDJ18]MBO2546118.1 hypothetical protein [Salegentibacter sp. BDJ18]
MAKFFKPIIEFFSSIWNWRKKKRFNSINDKLETKLRDRTKERREFISEFKFELRKYLRRDASGKYIPIKGKNKAEIYEHVMHKHGTRLEELDLKFSKDLQIKL